MVIREGSAGAAGAGVGAGFAGGGGGVGVGGGAAHAIPNTMIPVTNMRLKTVNNLFLFILTPPHSSFCLAVLRLVLPGFTISIIVSQFVPLCLLLSPPFLNKDCSHLLRICEVYNQEHNL